MKILLFREFSVQLNSTCRQIHFRERIRPPILPIPHRSIPDLRGNDLDFVTFVYSYLIHGEWSKLSSFVCGLNPFRIKHVLLKIQKDPVLSLKFYDWAVVHNSNSQTIEIHSIILHILTKARRFRAADSIFKRHLLLNVSNSDLFESLINSYRLYDSSPNVFDALFKSYAHSKKFRSATDTFYRMRDYGFQPTIRSCNAFMSSLIGHGRHDIVLSFYRQMKRCRISPNLYTINMVILSYCTSGKFETASELFHKIESLGFAPSVPSFNTLITGYCNKKLMSSAMKTKNEMQLKGHDPNIVTYNTIIHGFCKEGDLHGACKILGEMKAKRINPNIVTFNTLINGYSQTLNGEKGLAFYEEMKKNGVKPDILTYNALISGFCNEGKTKKASHLVKEMVRENLLPNLSTFSALISGQCKVGNSERAFEIYEVMKKNGCYPNCQTFKAMINVFCENRDYQGALCVLREMMEAWITLEKGSITRIFEGLNGSENAHLEICS